MGTAYYQPVISQPTDHHDLALAIAHELHQISMAFQAVTTRAELTTIEPIKPVLGDIVLADGANWNPGSGRGVYCFDNGTWRFLG